MHEQEIRVLWRGGALLAIASLVRLVVGGPADAIGLESPSVLDSLLLASVQASERDERRGRALRAGEQLDPNEADSIELARLPGIGPALASRIVEERGRGGAFMDPADLTRVKGIGPRAVERLGPFLEFRALGLAGVPARRQSARPNSPTAAFDVDTATRDEWVRLRGIGPVLAARILEDRKRNGPFRSASGLVRVPGIGPARIRSIEEELNRGFPGSLPPAPRPGQGLKTP